MKTQVFSLFLCAIFLKFEYIVASESNCEVLLSEADTCVRKGLVFGGHWQPPKNTDDMDRLCKLGRQYISCTRRYGSCLKTMPKQVYGILLANSRKILKETCSTEGKEIFLQHVNQFCITDDKLNHFVEEVEKMTVMLNYVATNVSSEEVIPWTCCAYFKAYEKIERQIKNNCAPMPTPQSTIDFFITGWKKSVSEAIDLACGQYSSLQSCEQRLPKATNVFKSLIPNDLPVGRQSTTFLTPMIRIAHKMDA